MEARNNGEKTRNEIIDLLYSSLLRLFPKLIVQCKEYCQQLESNTENSLFNTGRIEEATL